MNALVWMSTLVGTYALANELLARRYKHRPHSQPHVVATPDGWPLALMEYDGGSKGVVYLQHGLGATHLSFDFHPHGPSLARWLADRGYHVYAGNLRGRFPGQKAFRPRPWHFSDYLVRDTPAMGDFLWRRHGRKIHWVGHSLGGILGLGYAAQAGKTRIATLTTLGSALHYGIGPSDYTRLLKLRPVLARLKYMPDRRMVQLWGLLSAARILPDDWHYNRDNLEASTVLSFHANSDVPICLVELLELASTFEGEGILCAELGARLPKLAAKLDMPWLCLAGAADRQCPPETARWTFERVQAPRKEWLVAAKEHGFGHDYGHVDLLAGREAPAEIFGRIAGFIESSSAGARCTGVTDAMC